jgi:hypothetical protein
VSLGAKRTSGRRAVALLALAVAVAALCFGALAGTAGASKAKSVKTTVKIYSGNSERFSGRVITGKKPCMKARKVTLYVNSASAGQRIRGRYFAGYEVVGSAKSKANGTWLVRSRAEPFLAGLYRAYVAARTVTSGGETFRCMAVWGKPLNA